MSTPTPDGFDPDDFDVVACSAQEFIAWLSGYRAGLWQSTTAEIARREAEDRAVYQMAVRTVHGHSRLPIMPREKQIPRRWVDRDVAS
jgi:hypothetical protein